MGRSRDRIGPGRVAAVTGAASGIGRSLALALGQAGVTLALGDLDDQGLAEVAGRVRRAGGVAGRSRVLVGADAHVADALARLTGTGYEHVAGLVQRVRRR